MYFRWKILWRAAFENLATSYDFIVIHIYGRTSKNALLANRFCHVPTEIIAAHLFVE